MPQPLLLRRFGPGSLAVLSLISLALLAVPNGALSPAAPPQNTASDGPRPANAAERYGELPLSFEANLGQASPEVKFVARGSEYKIALQSTGAALSLNPKSASQGARRGELHQAGTGRDQLETQVLRMKLAGSNARASTEGVDPLPGVANYFIGGDPARWHAGIPCFAAVRCEAVYPGIDLIYYGNQRQLEYDFSVAAGADPAAITLSFEGAGGVRVDEGGNLALALSAGEISHHKPLVYQDSGGIRSEVLAHWVIKGEREAGFSLGAYDHTKPLIIDPVLVYSTYLGGCCREIGHAIAVDAAGNAYITGETDSVDFPTTAAGAQVSLAGSTDAFVTKLNALGTAVLYSTYIGGEGTDRGLGIAVDSLGNAYVAGRTDSARFPVTANAFQVIIGGYDDAFVAKLNSTGTKLDYCTYLGGENSDVGFGIAVDSSRNAYITGVTGSLRFPVTGVFQSSLKGANDAFVAKLNPGASGAASLVYSTFLGGGAGDEGDAIALDSAANAYVAGHTGSSDFPVTSGAAQQTRGGFGDAFAIKLNANGTALLYSTFIGGSGLDAGHGIAVDSSGRAYVAGETTSADLPTSTGVFQGTLRGARDAFVIKLNAAGSSFLYSTYLGGEGFDEALAAAVDSGGNVWVTGLTNSIAYPTTPGAAQPGTGGRQDAFVTRLNAAGSALLYSTYLGGASAEAGRGVALDVVGDAYVTGFTLSGDYPVTAGVVQPAFRGGYDVLVAKIGETADVAITMTADATALTGSNIVYSITVANTGPGIATFVVMTDTLPAGTRFVSLTSSQGTSVVPPVGGTGTVTSSLGSIAAGSLAMVTLEVSVDCAVAGGSSIANTAMVSSFTPDLALANNTVTASVRADASAAPPVVSPTTLIFPSVNAKAKRPRNAPSRTFTISNSRCTDVRVRFKSIRRERCGSGDQRVPFRSDDDSALFLVGAPLNTDLTIPALGSSTFTIFFSPKIPTLAASPPPGSPQFFFAGEVLPRLVCSNLDIEVRDIGGPASNFSVSTRGSVAEGVRLIDPVDPRRSPLVVLERSGDQFIAHYFIYDSDPADVESAKYEFFDAKGRPVPLVPSEVGEDLRRAIRDKELFAGQSFEIIQTFSNARKHPEATTLRVTVFGAGKSSTSSAESRSVVVSGGAAITALRRETDRAVVILPTVTLAPASGAVTRRRP